MKLLIKTCAILSGCLLGLVAACSSDDSSDPTPGAGGTSATGGGGAGAQGGNTSQGGSTSQGGGNQGGGNQGGGNQGGAGACSPTDILCETQVFLEMNLQDDIAPGAITDEADGSGFKSLIDATAGGAFTPDPHSYVYAKFTSMGLEKVSLNDEDSVDSMDWAIAFRRYLIRINSGHSGPSCVEAARVLGTPDYDTMTTVPGGLTFNKDEYFTVSCDLIPDGSGLNSPATALSGYWTYPGCVKMTGNVYIIKVADGRHFKFTVTHYYNETAQQQCQDTGTTPGGNTGSANIRIRWAELP